MQPTDLLAHLAQQAEDRGQTAPTAIPSSQALATELARLAVDMSEAAVASGADPNHRPTHKRRAKTPADLLPPHDRRAVALAVGDWPTAGRTQAVRAKWQRLALTSVEALHTPGVVIAPADGLPGLARRLDPVASEPKGAWDRVLKTWTTTRAPRPEGLGFGEPMVRLFKKDHGRGLVAVQIPLLTENLLWLLHARTLQLAGQGPTPSTALAIACAAARAGIVVQTQTRLTQGEAVVMLKGLEAYVAPKRRSVKRPPEADLAAAQAWVRSYEREPFPSPTDKFLWDMRLASRSPVAKVTDDQAAKLVRLHKGTAA